MALIQGRGVGARETGWRTKVPWREQQCPCWFRVEEAWALGQGSAYRPVQGTGVAKEAQQILLKSGGNPRGAAGLWRFPRPALSSSSLWHLPIAQ